MDIKRALNFIESRTTEKPVVTEIVNELTDHLNGLADKIQSLQSQCEVYRENLEWASGQFGAIRLYTQDRKIAAACAEGESKIDVLNQTKE